MSRAADAADAMALLTALRLLSRPAWIHALRRASLPSGVTLLLEVVGGDDASMTRATRLTGCPPDVLAEAAAFFVEEILFCEKSDCYRVLGGSPSTSSAVLRRHVALLMRWLHPDANAHLGAGRIDRSVFTTKVTTAWQALKTPERRASYDAGLRTGRPVTHAEDRQTISSRSRARLRLRPLANDDALTRLLLFFWGKG